MTIELTERQVELVKHGLQKSLDYWTDFIYHHNAPEYHGLLREIKELKDKLFPEEEEADTNL